MGTCLSPPTWHWSVPNLSPPHLPRATAHPAVAQLFSDEDDGATLLAGDSTAGKDNELGHTLTHTHRDTVTWGGGVPGLGTPKLTHWRQLEQVSCPGRV